VAFDHGRIVERSFGDVYRFDTKPDLPYVEPPVALQNHLLGDASWQIADAAWSPDFPTAAQDTLRLYEIEGGDTDIDGVVVITTFAIDRLLAATGPVTVPEYGVTVSAGQTTAIALFMTRGGVTTPGTDRKAFLDDLAGALLDRLQHISPLQAPAVKTAFDEIRQRRDVMVWVKDPAAEAWFAASPFGGQVGQQPGDFVYVVEANVEPPSKYNLVVARNDRIDVALDAQGNASDTLLLNWQNFSARPDPFYELIRQYSTSPAGLYGAYVRLLTPSSSQLVSASGNASNAIDDVEESSTAAGRNVFGNYLLMAPGKSDLTYAWMVPGAAKATDGEWSYHLTVQRQPGAVTVPVTIHVALPAGATVVSTTGAKADDGSVSMSATLDRDLSLDVRYRLP
jgi:hypothetical protein